MSAEGAADELAKIKEEALALATTVEAQAGAEGGVAQPWSPELVTYLATAILAFGLGVMLIMGWLVVRRGITQGVLRLICVPLIVVAAVFLMVVGYDDQQLTPIVGLLGTIAGYLLGKTDPVGGGTAGGRGGSRDGSAGRESHDVAEPEAPAPIS
jgi:hypothetical protein